jgi:hypothetical protein
VYDLVAPDPHELWPQGDLDVHLVRGSYRWLYPNIEAVTRRYTSD